MSTDHVKTADRYRRQLYRRNRVPEDFEDIVADHRSIGRTDDDLALTFGISVEALHKRFRDRGIPCGRRWRGIEENTIGNAITKDEARRIVGDDATAQRWFTEPAVLQHRRAS